MCSHIKDLDVVILSKLNINNIYSLALTSTSWSLRIDASTFKICFINTYNSTLPLDEDYELIYNTITNIAEDTLWIMKLGYTALLSAHISRIDIDECLIQASSRGYLPFVKLLVDNGADIHAQNDLGYRLAAIANKLEVVEFLLTKGIDINNDAGNSLITAVENRAIPMITLLLDKGANIHVYHDISLRIAAFKGYTEIVDLLIARGANINMLKYNI